MKHLRGYVFKNGQGIFVELDVKDSAEAHKVISARFPHYMFLIEREVEEDE